MEPLNLNAKKALEKEPEKLEQPKEKQEPKLFKNVETAGTIACNETQVQGGSKLFNVSTERTETTGTVASNTSSAPSSSSGGGSVSALA